MPLTSSSLLPSSLRYSNQFFCVITDTAGILSAVNRLFITQAGTPSYQAHFSESLVAEDKEKYTSAVAGLLENPGSPVSVCLKHLFLSGDSQCIQWELSILPDHKEEALQVQWIGFAMTAATGSDLEKYNAYKSSAEGLWRMDFKSPVPVTLPFQELLTRVNRDGFLAECNDKMAEMYGFSKAEELYGTKVSDLVALENISWIEGIRQFAASDFKTTLLETKEYDRNGNALYFINSITGVVENGILLRIWGTQQDITDRKKAEEKIRVSELFYRELIRRSLDGILLTNEEGVIDFASDSAFAILGYDEEDLVGKKAFDFVHPDDVYLGVNSFYQEVQGTQQRRFISIRLLQKSGNWLWCMIRGHNLLDNALVGKMLIYFCDDTLRLNAETELLTSKERYLHLIQHLHTGLMLCDGSGNILICNSKCGEIFNIPEDSFIGKNLFNPDWEAIYEDGTVAPHESYPVALAVRTKKSVRDVIMGVHRKQLEGMLWLSISAEPVFEADGTTLTHVICAFSDITEQRLLARQLKEQEVQKQKLLIQATLDGQEKERSEISRELHDNISQHLTTTRLYLEVAKDKTTGQVFDLVQQAHKSVQTITSEIRRLTQSLAPPELQNIGLTESIKDLCNSLKKIHAFTISFLHDDFREDLLPDNMKLTLFRIIQEQVNNVIRHALASSISISLETVKDELRLTIADNGKGFDPQLVKKGLGLTNIFNRAELFGGTARIITHPGSGCTLYVKAVIK